MNRLPSVPEEFDLDSGPSIDNPNYVLLCSPFDMNRESPNAGYVTQHSFKVEKSGNSDFFNIIMNSFLIQIFVSSHRKFRQWNFRLFEYKS